MACDDPTTADFRFIPILSNVSTISRNYTVVIFILKPGILNLSILTLEGGLGELWRRIKYGDFFFYEFCVKYAFDISHVKIKNTESSISDLQRQETYRDHRMSNDHWNSYLIILLNIGSFKILTETIKSPKASDILVFSSVSRIKVERSLRLCKIWQDYVRKLRPGISFSGSSSGRKGGPGKQGAEMYGDDIVARFLSSRWIFVARIGACRPIEMHGTSLRFQYGEKFLNGRPVAAQECMEMLRTTSVLYCPTWWLVAG